MKLNSWFEIDEQEYLVYILRGYEIIVDKEYVQWLLNGKCHREDGPAVIRSNGTQSWWLNGKRHRENGPAIIYKYGTQSWWLNGQRHREDGPAIIRADGTLEWWLNNKRYTESEFNEKIKQLVRNR